MYIKNDNEYRETTITKVEDSKDHWHITDEDGWSFSFEKSCKVIPKSGMTACFYGKGIGHTVRGLFIDGKQVFYRTEEEEKEYSDIRLYGADCKDWLSRWDNGQSVWSIEMGGLGPGYEQAIQITLVEILRHLIATGYDYTKWTGNGDSTWKTDLDKIEKFGFANPSIKKLGLSGAQWGTAVHLACQFYRRGPREVMNDEKVKDRHIQVQRDFP